MFCSSSFGGPVPALTAIVAAACLTLPGVRAATPEPYAAAEAYKAGALVLGADGNAYRAAADVKGSDPVTSGGDGWRLAHAASDLVIDVPGRFKTIAEAWRFLAGARIAETATVTIELAPGELGHDAPLVLNHAEGARIVLRGAGDKPEDCRLVFDGGDGIVVNGGSEVRVENLTLATKARDRGTAFLIDHGSAARIRDCKADGFAAGAFVNDRSRLRATDCEFVTSGTKDCLAVRTGSSGIFVDCTARATGSDRRQHGFAAFNGGAIECFGCKAEGWYSGFSAIVSSTMFLERCVGSRSNHGASAWAGSSLMAVDCNFNNNKQTGVSAMYSTAEIMGGTFSGNNSGVAANGSATVNFGGSPTKISDCKIGFFSHFGGRARLATRPVFKNVDREIAVGSEPGNLTAEGAVLRVE
jgi:hypothetical protein